MSGENRYTACAADIAAYGIGGLRCGVVGAELQRCFEMLAEFTPFALPQNDRYDIVLREADAESEESALWSMSDVRGREISIWGSIDGSVAINPTDDYAAMRFALWVAYNMTAGRYGAFGVHSSSVAMKDRAVIFLGESGTGKSTHSRLWLGCFDDCHLLNDDSPVVRASDDGVRVYGSPWSGKTPCYRNEEYRLAGVVRLRQCKENRIRRLEPLSAISALLPSFPPEIVGKEPFSGFIYEALGRVVEQVPVFLLDCLPDDDAALLCRSTLESYWGSTS